jgi:hypothetical protein
LNAEYIRNDHFAEFFPKYVVDPIWCGGYKIGMKESNCNFYDDAAIAEIKSIIEIYAQSVAGAYIELASQI